MSLGDLVRALFGANERTGEPALKFGFRGENIFYSSHGREMEITFTHRGGARVYTHTIQSWNDGTPLDEHERERIFLDVVRFVKRNFEKPIVVIKDEDPSRSDWERLTVAHARSIKSVERTSEEQRRQFERETFLRILRSGKLVINDTAIRDEAHLDEYLAETRRQRGS